MTRPVRRIRACEICGATYRPTYSEQRTCGRTCGQALRRAQVYTAACQSCGTSIRWTGDGGKPLWCSDACRPRAEVAPKTCAICSASYTMGGHRYCGSACASAAKRRQDTFHNNARRTLVRHCLCGVEIPVRRNRCQACVEATKQIRKRRERIRRRRLSRGVVSERYTLAEIAERDKRTCRLCRKRVAMRQVVPHPKAPTVDHVVPLADGGDDTRANVQLAHFLCNATKRELGTQQLTLVG